jgi:hypothetical protein
MPPASIVDGQLVGVADEDDLGVCGRCVIKQSRELTGAHHAGLVHHDNRIATELVPCLWSANSRWSVVLRMPAPSEAPRPPGLPARSRAHVPERRGDHAVDLDSLDTTVAAPRPGGVARSA